MLLRQACGPAKKLLAAAVGEVFAGLVWTALAGDRLGVRLGVIPRQPVGGAGLNRGGVALQGGQVIEGVDLVEPAGVDEAHKGVGS